MALTNRGKQQAMSVGIASKTRYISLHLANGTELTVANGYKRKAITNAQMAVSAAGVITSPANFGIYTANTNAAQRAVKVGLYETLAGNDQLFEPEDLDGVDTDDHPLAPVNGQEFRLSLTLNP